MDGGLSATNSGLCKQPTNPQLIFSLLLSFEISQEMSYKIEIYTFLNALASLSTLVSESLGSSFLASASSRLFSFYISISLFEKKGVLWPD